MCSIVIVILLYKIKKALLQILKIEEDNYMDKNKTDLIEIYPLTVTQKTMLMECLLHSDSRLYVEQFMFRVKGNVSVSKIIKVWNKIQERHKMIGAVIKWQGLKQPLLILGTKKANIKEYNLYGIAEELKNDYINTIVETKWKESVNIINNSFEISIFHQNGKDIKILLDFHHIIFDGWSMSILINEFFDCINNKNVIQKITPSYKKYISYYLQSLETNQIASFWESYIGKLKTINLNIDYLLKEDIFEYTDYYIPERYLNKIKLFSVENNFTLASIIYYLWFFTLLKYNNDDKIIFGITVSGRNIDVAGIDDITGMMIKTLPLKLSSSLINYKPKEIIKKIMEEVILLSQHELAFDSFRQKTNINLNNLYQTVVTVQSYPNNNNFYSEESAIKLIYRRYQNSLPLSLGVRIYNNISYFDFSYNSRIYSKETVDEIYKNMLTNIEKL